MERTTRRVSGSGKINKSGCRYAAQCGGCLTENLSYRQQLEKKQKYLEKLLGGFCQVSEIIGMKNPLYYRNKVHRAFTRDRSGNIISGPYEAGSHWIIDVDKCQIENEKCQEIAESVRLICKKLRVPVYNEKTGHGVLRRVLVRRGYETGEVMVVLVIGNSKFTEKKEFVRELLKRHSEIKTVISNLNDKRTSMILGEKEEILYGEGFIHDRLCGLTFCISAKSFYQVNPVQTEILYKTAMEFAGLKGNETVIDAYCGIGTIGLCAAAEMKKADAQAAGKVIGIELNSDAVKDARKNALNNSIENARFICADAGEKMKEMAGQGETADVVFMDPPRSGSTIQFMKAAARLKPEKIIYISCGPESLAKNLKFFSEQGYECKKIQPVDMFPGTSHVETVVLMSRKNS